MRPDVVLGFDPARGDPLAVAAMAELTHRVVRSLVEARSGLDGLGHAGSVWDGALAAPVVALLRRYSLQVSELEDSLVGCLTALDAWRTGLEERQAEVADLVDRMADLAGDTSADERRARLESRAREIASLHREGARDLALGFEALSLTRERLARAEGDLASELEAAVAALEAAVEQWVEVEGPELVRTAASLGEVAALTTVISELVGVAALDRAPADGAGVRDIVSRSPGAHRLIKALRQRWLELAPTRLPAASFEGAGRTDLARLLAGRLAPPSPESPAQVDPTQVDRIQVDGTQVDR